MNILLKPKNNINKSYLTVSILGKSLKLNIKYRSNPIAEINKENDELNLYLPKKYKTMSNVNILNMAIEKMYDEIAEKEIENSMEEVRILLGFAPEDYKIKRLKNNFYTYNKNRVITINPDIVKYNKKIIDTTLIQAFCKMKYNPNSKIYKETLIKAIDKYENHKHKLIKKVKIIDDKKRVS